MTKDTQSRKWQITINNPLNKGYTHEKIKEQLALFKSCVYWCMSDEVGKNEQTPHTHVFMACSSAVRFSTLLNRFEECHFEMCKGTCQQNRDYVFKEGKYKGSDKEETRIDGSQEEWGEMPVERQGKRNDLDDLFDMIQGGMSDADIIRTSPEYMLNLQAIAQTRLILQQEKFKNVFRHVEVTYIWGDTATGKTRYVMEKYGYENVYKITNYKHPFDYYQGQDVILFDEFRSSLDIGAMLDYLDGYPINLPSRYMDKHACYTKVYFTSNIPLSEQYPEKQLHEYRSYKAFIRRIHFVIEAKKKEKFKQLTLDEYMDSQSTFKLISKYEN